jgi:hypothetical protein
MKIDRTQSLPATDTRELSATEIDSVSGGGFRLAAPGGNYYVYARPSGPLSGGYVTA